MSASPTPTPWPTMTGMYYQVQMLTYIALLIQSPLGVHMPRTRDNVKKLRSRPKVRKAQFIPHSRMFFASEKVL
jgi:hypothetical protein